MERKEHTAETAAMYSALEAGYKASRSVSTALRRVSDLTSQPVRNDLAEVDDRMEEALFAIEQVLGVEGSIPECISECRSFIDGYRKALESDRLEERQRWTLQDGLAEAEEALAGLSTMVDGYLSFTEDDT